MSLILKMVSVITLGNSGAPRDPNGFSLPREAELLLSKHLPTLGDDFFPTIQHFMSSCGEPDCGPTLCRAAGLFVAREGTKHKTQLLLRILDQNCEGVAPGIDFRTTGTNQEMQHAGFFLMNVIAGSKLLNELTSDNTPMDMVAFHATVKVFVSMSSNFLLCGAISLLGGNHNPALETLLQFLDRDQTRGPSEKELLKRCVWYSTTPQGQPADETLPATVSVPQQQLTSLEPLTVQDILNESWDKPMEKIGVAAPPPRAQVFVAPRDVPA